MNRALPILATLALIITTYGAAAAPATTRRYNIDQTVIKMPLAPGVSPDDAADALQSTAINLNMKLVAHEPLSKQLTAMGIKSGRLDIFQFCNPADAHAMVVYDPVFAAYMPCRIALVEDNQGKYWLEMINLDMLIDNAQLPPKQKAIATRINHTLLTIMKAGAAGNF